METELRRKTEKNEGEENVPHPFFSFTNVCYYEIKEPQITTNFIIAEGTLVNGPIHRCRLNVVSVYF